MPRLVIIKGSMKGQVFGFGDKTLFLGRSVKNDIQIRDTAISRKQLKIYPIGKRYFVEDLKSTNGTYINDNLIRPGEGYEVSEGDTIEMGDTAIRLDDFPSITPLEAQKIDTDLIVVEDGEIELPSQERRSHSQQELELVYKVSELIKLDISLSGFIDKLLDYLLEALPRIDQVVFILFNSGDRPGEIKDIIAKTRQGKIEKSVSYKHKVVEKVVQKGKAIRMSNTAYESPQDYKESTTIRYGSIMCVPMISNLKIRGVIYVDSFRGAYAFRRDDLLMLSSLSGSVAGAVEKASLSSLLMNGTGEEKRSKAKG